MSRRHQSEGHEDALDRWLEKHQRALIEDLDAILDVEAGLAEVLLHSRHDALAYDLDNFLDIEAGLAELVPASGPDLPDTLSDVRLQEQGEVLPERLLSLVSHQVRLELRRHPNVMSVARTLDRALDFNLDHARTLARNLIRALDRTLGLDHNRARELARELDRDLVFALNRDFSLDLDDARSLAHARDLRRARDLDLAINRDLQHARELDRDLTHIIYLESTSSHAHALALALAHALDRAHAHAREFINFFISQSQKVISTALGRNIPSLSPDSVKAFLNDFTMSDLRSVALSGIDLTGVWWSEWGTLWPEVVDIESLKVSSDKVQKKPGVYVIRSDSAPERESANLT